MSTKTIIGVPLTLAGRQLPLSKAVRANGDFIFASGQLALEAGKLVGDDIETQTRKTMENIRDIFHEAGTDLSQTVNCTVILTDKNDFAGFNKAYSEFFPDRPPARTTLVADLLIPGARVEIAATALVSAP